MDLTKALDSYSNIEKGKMPIIGSGDNLIQWIHISDLIHALLLAKDNGKPGEIYLVAGRETKTQKELFSLLAKYLNVKSPDKKVPKQLAYLLAYRSMLSAKMKGRNPKLRPEHISRITSSRTFDIRKSEQELKFEPAVDYERGAREQLEEYLNEKQATNTTPVAAA